MSKNPFAFPRVIVFSLFGFPSFWLRAVWMQRITTQRSAKQRNLMRPPVLTYYQIVFCVVLFFFFGGLDVVSCFVVLRCVCSVCERGEAIGALS